MTQTGYVLVNGTELFIRTAGSKKEAIVMIHGSGMSSEYWLPQLQNEKLIENYRLVAIDLPGHGRSAWLSANPDLYRPDKLALLIDPLLKALNIENYILVGMSFGTNVIGEIRQPLAGCKGIVLASPCIVNDQYLPSTVIIATHNAHVMISPDPAEEELKEYAYHHEKKKEIADRYIQDYKKTDPNFREQLGQMMMTSGWSDELENIRKWKVPVAVVYGTEDLLLKKDYPDGYGPLWKGKVFLIEGVGHMLSIDNPQEFNEILLQFSNEVLNDSFVNTIPD